MSKKTYMDLATIIGALSLIVSGLAFWQAKRANEQYASVEHLNVEPTINYRSDLCQRVDCKPTLTVINSGKIVATRLQVFIIPAIVPPNRNDGLLLKYSFSNWNHTVPILRPGETVTVNLPQEFLSHVVEEGRKLAVNFKDGSTYKASTATPDRFVLEIQTKYLRESDLKEYTDKLYYVHSGSDYQWVSIDAANAPFKDELLSAIQRTEGVDVIDAFNTAGTDRVYR